MALNIDCYNSSYFLELDDSTIYGIVEGSNIGIPGAQRIYQEVWGKGYSPPSAVDYGNRQASLEIMLKGTSLDNLIVNYRQLETILLQAREYWTTKGVSGDRAFLSIQLAGMTYPIEYEILDGILGAGGIFQHIVKNTSAPVLAKIPLSLTLRPWGRPQALTRVTSGSLNNGGGTGATGGTYSMAAPAGDVPAPVKVSMSQNTANNARYILARRTVGNVANFAALWPMQCETGAFTGYTVTNIETSGNFSLSNVAVAAASDGNVLRLAHTNVGSDTLAPIIRITINDNLRDFYGRFRVLLRVDATPANMSALQLKYGGSGAAIALPNVSMSAVFDDGLVELGEIKIPAYDAPPGAISTSFNMELYGSFGSSNYDVDFDCLFLLPVDEQRMNNRFNAVTGANDIIVSDKLEPVPAFYQTDSTGVLVANTLLSASHTFFEWEHGKVNLWLPLVIGLGDSGSLPYYHPHTLTDIITLTFDGFPQYALLR